MKERGLTIQEMNAEADRLEQDAELLIRQASAIACTTPAVAAACRTSAVRKQRAATDWRQFAAASKDDGVVIVGFALGQMRVMRGQFRYS